VAAGAPAPSLVIGMPVGFVGVAESKSNLRGLVYLRSASKDRVAELAWLQQL